MERLKVSEIFYSLQGEARTVGIPTVFIRLTGCPLRCTYCDTAYAFQGGNWISIADMIQKVRSFSVPHVTVTGGEPLAQKGTLVLLTGLADLGFKVSLETSGAFCVAGVDHRVSKVIDIKTPSSGESGKNLYTNFDKLTPHDLLKVVIGDRNDYDWTKTKLEEFGLLGNREIYFSPTYQKMDLTTLANWILEDCLPVRLQIQLHKLIWGDKPGV